jgi:signal transduction histidine kinase
VIEASSGARFATAILGGQPGPAAPGADWQTFRTSYLFLLRWVLIVATSYLTLFSYPLGEAPVAVPAFIAAYLASNLVLELVGPRVWSRRRFETGLVLFDAAAVSLALLLTRNASTDFLLVYFLVMLMAALSEQHLLLTVTASALVAVVQLSGEVRAVGIEGVLREGHAIRIPFVFVVALFFGHLVQRTRASDREAERAREHERARSDFYSGVSHDLKNPLTVIQTLAEMLLDDDGERLSTKQTEIVRRIHASAQQIVSLSLNVLDASRVEDGRLSIRRESVRLREIAESALAIARSASQLKGVRLELVCDGGLPAIDVDPAQMARVVLNLVDNAIQHTPAGGQVTVTIGRNEDRLRMTIRDTGPGIAPDRRAALFEKYRKGGESRGSGLGLFIVKSIVEAHGGSVDLWSEPGAGTAVTVQLPL